MASAASPPYAGITSGAEINWCTCIFGGMPFRCYRGVGGSEIVETWQDLASSADGALSTVHSGNHDSGPFVSVVSALPPGFEMASGSNSGGGEQVFGGVPFGREFWSQCGEVVESDYYSSVGADGTSSAG